LNNAKYHLPAGRQELQMTLLYKAAGGQANEDQNINFQNLVI